MEKLGTLESEVLSHEVVDGRVKVVVRTVPGMKLPRVVRPVLRGKEVEFVDTRTFLQRDKGKLPFAQTFRTVNNITERASVAGTIVIDRAPVPIRGPDPSMVMGTMMGTSIRVQGECVVRIAGLGGKVEAIIVQNLKNAYGKLPDIVGEWVATREARVAATRPEVGFAGRLVPRPSIALGNLDAMDDVSSADVSSQETSPQTDPRVPELRRAKTEATEARRRSTARILSYMRGRRSARAGARRREPARRRTIRDESASLDPFVRGESFEAAPAPLAPGRRNARRRNDEDPRRVRADAARVRERLAAGDAGVFPPRLERAFERA